MRIIVTLIVLVLVSAALYTAYGILTFDPQKPAPLVFQEPTAESLVALGILPKDEKPVLALSPEQQERTQKAVERISQAITVYKQKEALVPQKGRDTMQILSGLMSSGALPAYFLSSADPRSFEMLNYDPGSTIETTAVQTSITCAADTSMMIGNDTNDAMNCGSAAKGDRVFIGGPGSDTISDASGNRVVNPGSGDDTITLGRGRSIVVLDENWGHDKLTVDCTTAAVAPGSAPQNFPVPWAAPYANFIVLSPRIASERVTWNGLVLTNNVTGDTLSVNKNCFTLVGAK